MSVKTPSTSGRTFRARAARNESFRAVVPKAQLYAAGCAGPEKSRVELVEKAVHVRASTWRSHLGRKTFELLSYSISRLQAT